MANLTYKDWGRIYAYMWLQDRIGNSHYKNRLEEDPVQAITEIVQALNKEYSDMKIEYTPGEDAVWNIELPKDFYPELENNEGELKKYRDGTKGATLRLRLVC